MKPTWRAGRFVIDLDRPCIMGIVNVTPDSFSDGNQHFGTQAAIAHGEQLVEQGAAILDIGGESTRPGAEPVSLQEEADRVLPVLEGLHRLGVPLSVDTFKPELMRLALASGADIINDIYGMRRPGAIEAVANSDCGLCIMHMQGEPRSMQTAPSYDDVLAEVRSFLTERYNCLLQAGIARDRIVLDPGLGFGKTLPHNIELLRRLPEAGIDCIPWLVGVSRKSMIGQLTGRPVNERLAGSLAAALVAVERGARVLRVHDVAATVDALKVWQAFHEESQA